MEREPRGNGRLGYVSGSGAGLGLSVTASGGGASAGSPGVSSTISSPAGWLDATASSAGEDGAVVERPTGEGAAAEVEYPHAGHVVTLAGSSFPHWEQYMRFPKTQAEEATYRPRRVPRG